MDFTRETAIKAVRKARRCDGCSYMVEIGQPAVSWAGLIDGDFQSLTYHPDCREAEISFNAVRGTYGLEDWTGLCEIEWDDHPWLLSTFPSVAARKGITAETIFEHQQERERCRIAWNERSRS